MMSPANTEPAALRRLLRTGTAALLLLAAGCSDAPQKQTEEKEPAFIRQYRDGSLTVLLSADETDISTAGRIRLQLDVQAPASHGVVLPSLDTQIEPFTLADIQAEPTQVLRNQKTLHRWTFILHPDLPGEFIFQPLEISAGPSLVTTEPIPVSVHSILPSGTNDTLEIRDIAGPIELLPHQARRNRMWLIALGGTLLIIIVVVLIQMRKRAQIEIPLEPHERAFLSMESLQTENPEPPEFMHELNRILRTYIEQRFELPVLGKTTPEILPILEEQPIMPRTDELTEFLKKAEQSRFAHAVTSDETAAAADFVISFIEQTRETAEEEPCA